MTTPSILQCLSAKVLGTRHQTVLKTKNVLCVVKLIHTKTVQTETKKAKCANCRGPQVAKYRGCPACKDKPLGNM